MLLIFSIEVVEREEIPKKVLNFSVALATANSPS